MKKKIFVVIIAIGVLVLLGLVCVHAVVMNYLVPRGYYYAMPFMYDDSVKIVTSKSPDGKSEIILKEYTQEEKETVRLKRRWLIFAREEENRSIPGTDKNKFLSLGTYKINWVGGDIALITYQDQSNHNQPKQWSISCRSYDYISYQYVAAVLHGYWKNEKSEENTLFNIQNGFTYADADGTYFLPYEESEQFGIDVLVWPKTEEHPAISIARNADVVLDADENVLPGGTITVNRIEMDEVEYRILKKEGDTYAQKETTNEPFVSGDNKFYLKDYKIEEQGLSGLMESIQQCVELPARVTVAYFDSKINKKTCIESFQFTLNGYDAEGNYQGRYSFLYSGDDSILTYLPPEEYAPYEIQYNANEEVLYLDGQIKRLPLQEQIKKLDFKQYVLTYRGSIKLEEGLPIIDGSKGQGIPVMTMKDYEAKMGGAGDGHTAVVIMLSDGQGMTGSNIIRYSCVPNETEQLLGDRNFTMQYDYYINNEELFFTRDYGETWEKAGISKDELAETLAFYGRSLTIPVDSYYLDGKTDGLIALFMGKEPILYISRDNGGSWDKHPLQINWKDYAIDGPKDITRRIVGFSSAQDGYAAIGTDWSMGTGEAKTSYFTHDGGLTFEEKELPEAGSSNTLTDMYFMDGSIGVLTLKSISDDVPTLYYTMDGADTWKIMDLPWEDMMADGIDRIQRIDSLTYENGIYTLILQQEEDSHIRVSFTGDELEGTWHYMEQSTAVIHTVG